MKNFRRICMIITMVLTTAAILPVQASGQSRKEKKEARKEARMLEKAIRDSIRVNSCSLMISGTTLMMTNRNTGRTNTPMLYGSERNLNLERNMGLSFLLPFTTRKASIQLMIMFMNFMLNNPIYETILFLYYGLSWPCCHFLRDV